MIILKYGKLEDMLSLRATARPTAHCDLALQRTGLHFKRCRVGPGTDPPGLEAKFKLRARWFTDAALRPDPVEQSESVKAHGVMKTSFDDVIMSHDDTNESGHTCCTDTTRIRYQLARCSLLTTS